MCVVLSLQVMVATVQMVVIELAASGQRELSLFSFILLFKLGWNKKNNWKKNIVPCVRQLTYLIVHDYPTPKDQCIEFYLFLLCWDKAVSSHVGDFKIHSQTKLLFGLGLSGSQWSSLAWFSLVCGAMVGGCGVVRFWCLGAFLFFVAGSFGLFFSSFLVAASALLV